VSAAVLQTSEPFEPWGWAYNVNSNSVPKDISIQIVSASNDVAVTAPLNRSSRPDVAKAFSKPELEMSGFVGKVDVSGLASGTYSVKIIQQEGTTRYVCTSPVKLKFHSAKG
jgi:YbbR domain-containing protein